MEAQEYEEKITEANLAVEQVVEEETESLFTVVVSGVTIVPDVDSLSYSTELHCPDGMTNSTMYCGEH